MWWFNLTYAVMMYAMGYLCIHILLVDFQFFMYNTGAIF